MKSRALDDRQSHVGIRARLKTKNLLKMRKLSRYRGPMDLTFFEKVVWWWRPLGAILAKQTPFEAVESKSTGFFPKEIFAQLQFAYLTGDMRRLTYMWVGEEIAARVEGHVSHYPAFIDDSFLASEMGANPRWREWRKQSIQIDLGRKSADIIQAASEQIDGMRERLFAKTRRLLVETPKKQSFEADSFRACEFIDVQMFGLLWAPANRIKFDDAVIRRAMRTYLLARVKPSKGIE